MNDYFKFLFEYLNTPDNAVVIAIVFAAINVFALLIRIILVIGYQSQYAIFKVKSKEIKAITDVKDSNFGVFNKVIKDYIKNSKKGSYFDTEKLIKKHLLQLSFCGWSYEGMGRFIHKFEVTSLFTGILLSLVFTNYAFTFGVLAVSAFILIKFLSVILDFETLTQRLTQELTEYINREIGQFYSNEFIPVINRFKSEFVAAINRQSVSLSETTQSLSHELTNLLGSKIKETNLKLEEHISGLSDTVKKLLKTTEDLKAIMEPFSLASDTMKGQLSYIKENQSVLRDSLQSYEVALHEVTKEVGSGLGRIMEFQVKEAYGKLNDDLKSNIDRTTSLNTELIQRLQQLFDSMMNQSRAEALAIKQLKEQMDFYLNPPNGEI